MRSIFIFFFLVYSFAGFSQIIFENNRQRPDADFHPLQQSRNFLLPNGFAPHEAHLRSYYMYVNEVNMSFGKEKEFYGGVGFLPFGGFVIFPHFGYSKEIRDNVRLGGGAYFFNGSGLEFNEPFSRIMPFLTLTEGTPERYFHLFFGKVFQFNPGFLDGHTDVIGAGASWKTGRRWRYFTELIYANIDFEEEDFLLINNHGMSWFFRSHKLDMGIGLVAGPLDIFFDSESLKVLPLPFISYSVVF